MYFYPFNCDYDDGVRLNELYTDEYEHIHPQYNAEFIIKQM